MRVYRLRKSCISGQKGFAPTVYLDSKVAAIRAKDMEEEWTSWIAEAANADLVDDGRCVIDRMIYDLDRTTATEEYRMRGLSKLSEDERLALGLDS